jgi:hypothetical protein
MNRSVHPVLDSSIHTPAPQPSRLAAGIAASPSHNTLTGVQKMADVWKKTHRPNQGESPDIGVRKRLLKLGGGSEDRAAFGNDIVDQDDS